MIAAYLDVHGLMVAGSTLAVWLGLVLPDAWLAGRAKARRRAGRARVVADPRYREHPLRMGGPRR